MTTLGRQLAGGTALWVVSGLVVLAAHGAAVQALANRPNYVSDNVDAIPIVLDLAPLPAAPAVPETALPVGPLTPPQEGNDQTEEKEQQQAKIIEEPQPETPPPPPQVKPEVTLPAPKPPEPKPKKVRKVEAAAPMAQREVSQQYAAQSIKYGDIVAAHLRRHNTFSNPAQNGLVANLSFTLNRQGHVISSRIVHGSGDAAFDRDALIMLNRAQPFPPAPDDLPNREFQYTVPIRYKAH